MEDLGEKRFLAEVLPHLTPHRSFINGFGDDASAIAIDEENAVLFKIDRAAAPVAARRGWTDYRMWGRLAVTSNCSDVLAGGGSPIAVMIAMILPRDWDSNSAVEVIEGCAEECATRDIVFAGGDTKEGRYPEIVGSAVGTGRRDELLTRRGAKPGDVIVLAGSLGGFLGSYLQILDLIAERGEIAGPKADSWLHYVSHPTARWDEGAAVRDSRVATAGMDTSDGLYDAIATLTTAYGAEIDLDALPYHDTAVECGERLGISTFNLGLGVGDWNIVYIVDEQRWRAAEGRFVAQGLELSVVGRVCERPGIRWYDSSGRSFSCAPVVNQHFKSRLEDESTLLTRLRDEQMLEPIVE